MEKIQTWTVRDGDEKDLSGILSLRKIVFGEMEEDKLEPRFWRWEFMEAPDGKALIYIVQDRDKIIAHFADIPRRFSVNGEAVLATLSLDLMVHPDYRREGLFTAMGKYGVQRVKQKNGLFMMAFPIRPETIQGFTKIGWGKVVQLPVIVHPIRFSGIVNRYLHFKPLSLLLGGVATCVYLLLYGWKKGKKGEAIHIEEVVQLDEAFDDFWQSASRLYSVMGIRTRQYLNWRYFKHPTRRYTVYRAIEKGEMRGYMVLRKVELLSFNSAVIVDLLALDERALYALVEKGVQHSRQEDVNLLGFMVPKPHPYFKSLKRWGFLPSPKAFSFMIFAHTGGEDLSHSEGWYVNWGDTDVL
jgi:GNAT superfamily N-acetyltransferase